MRGLSARASPSVRMPAAAQAGELRPLPRRRGVGRDRRVIGPGAQRRDDRPQVHPARDQGRGAVVERGQRRPAGDAVVAVDAPCPPAEPRQQARRRRTRPASCGPHQDHQGHSAHSPIRTGTTSSGTDGSARCWAATARMSSRKANSKSYTSMVERRFGRPGRTGVSQRRASRSYQVTTPSTPMMPPQAAAGRGHPGGLEHALVVGELEEVLPALAGRDPAPAPPPPARVVRAGSSGPASRPEPASRQRWCLMSTGR